MEGRVIEALPVIQGDGGNEQDSDAKARMVHEVVVDLERRVGEQAQDHPVEPSHLHVVNILDFMKEKQISLHLIVFTHFLAFPMRFIHRETLD
jgi:hypothetical protein